MEVRGGHDQQGQEKRKSDLDLEANVQEEHLKNSKGWRFWVLVYQSIGVVYGGLGTSPLYVYPNIFTSTPEPAHVLGSMSLIFWTLTIVVIFKYVSLVLHANDNGEGGTIAMYSLLCRHARISYFNQVSEGEDALTGVSKPAEQQVAGPNRGRWLERSKALQKALLGIVLLGTAFMFCDGVLSPSASVVSAVAGVQVINPNLTNEVIAAISCAILLALFSIQRFGSSRLGMAFSPVLLLWFLVNAAIGIYNIVSYKPDVFKAISPHYAFQYFVSGGRAAWVSLTGVVLCISGSEATYADMGHFSHKAITIGTLGLVYPSLLLIYFGETAYLSKFPETYAQSYYRAIPEPLFWPCFIIAMASALVGSQSLITSAFSVVRQSAVLSCFLPVRVVHTGKSVEGQIYIPEVNWLLCILGIAVVAGFRDTVAIGNAFGLVVVMVMVIITVLITVVMLVVWNWHPIPVLAIFAFFFTMEGVYLSAVLYKVPRGGWFPLVVAAVVLCVAATWHWGSLLRLRHSRARSHRLVEQLLHAPDAPGTGSLRGGRLLLARGSASAAVTLEVLEQSGRSISRVPGIAVYLAEHASGLPSGFVHMLQTVGIVHYTVIFLTVQQVPLPSVAEEQRFAVSQLDMPGFYRVLCRVGYTDTLVRDAAFLESLLQAILEEARYKAMAAKWSAAEIHTRSPSQDLEGPALRAASLRRNPRTSRSMRNIEVPPAQQQELTLAAAPSNDQQPSPRPGDSHSCNAGAIREGSGGEASRAEERAGSVSFLEASRGRRRSGRPDSAIELPDIPSQQHVHDEASSCISAASSTPEASPRPGPSVQPAQASEHSLRSRDAGIATSPRSSADCDATSFATTSSATEQEGAWHRSGAQLSFRVQASAAAQTSGGGDSEAAAVLASREHGLTFVMARYVLRAAAGSRWPRRLLIENLYGTLRSVSYDANEAWCAVHEDVLDVRITCQV